MVMAAAAQIRGAAAPATARCSAVRPGARLLRFAPLSTVTVSASLRRGAFGGLTAGVESKSWITMCVKADYTSPFDPMTSAEQTCDEIQEPAIVAPANEETSTEQEAAPQQKCAKIHDFCLGIPFGGFLFSMGLIGFLFCRSPVSLTFGVAPGLAILALPLAAAVAWKHSLAYITTKKLLPWGFFAALSAAMICFYSYVLLAGGNPPPKKAATG